MKISEFTIYIIAFLVLCSGHIANASDDRWGGYVEFFAKPGTERSLAKGDMFIPLQQNEEFLLFANIRAVFDDDSHREGNFGLGARRLFNNWILGGYGYFDLKESRNDNTFAQATLGVELLSNEWDFRVNGYIAEKETEDVDALNGIEIIGNQIGVRNSEERALPGGDIEVGRKLPLLQDTRLFLGGFYYDASDFEEVSGPKARLEMRFHNLPFFNTFSKGSRLTIGAEFRDDSVRGSQAFGLVQLRIPFGSHSSVKTPNLSTLERRMVESVVRDEDVMIGEKTSDELLPVTNPATGQVINFVDTIDANTVNVPGTVTAAGQNSLIVADGSQGVIDVGASVVDVLPGQILAGGGQPINLQANGETLMFTPSGQRPTINRAGAGNLINIDIDDDVTVNGLDLQGGQPLRINNSVNVAVSNVTINSSVVEGVLVNNNSNAAFNNLNINNTGDVGFDVDNSSTVNVQNASISNSGDDGIRARNNSMLTVNTVEIDNVGSQGVFTNSGAIVNIDNVTINNTGDTGIESRATTLTLTNSNISNSGLDGLRVTNGTAAQVSNIVISNTDRDGVRVLNSSLNMNNSVIRDIGNGGAGDDAFHLTNSTLNGSNNSIQGAINSGMACRESGGANTGSLGFSSGPIVSCP